RPIPDENEVYFRQNVPVMLPVEEESAGQQYNETRSRTQGQRNNFSGSTNASGSRGRPANTSSRERNEHSNPSSFHGNDTSQRQQYNRQQYSTHSSRQNSPHPGYQQPSQTEIPWERLFRSHNPTSQQHQSPPQYQPSYSQSNSQYRHGNEF